MAKAAVKKETAQINTHVCRKTYLAARKVMKRNNHKVGQVLQAALKAYKRGELDVK